MSAPEIPVDAARVLARLDRLPRRAVSFAATGIAGAALFFVFYCNFDINVSFIQTCTQIRSGCTPGTSQGWLVLPTCLYLVGYFAGGLLFAPVSDRIGRKRALAIGLSFACVGSLLAAVATGYPLFVLARALTGISMGAVLPVANTYIGEIAPAAARAKYTAVTFVLCTLGAMCGIGFGLLLTTEAASFPEGLPFALGLESGWRWMYAIATVVGLFALLNTARLPESPRWLIEHGRAAEADTVVSALEQRARGPLPEPAATVPLPPRQAEHAYRELLSSKRYRRRVLLLVAMWFTGYATVFSYSTGSTVILTSLHFTAPVAGMISAVGGVGFFVQGLFSARWSERLDRRYWLPIGAALTVLGGILIATLGTNIGWAFAGSFLVFFGFNVWVPPTFALSAESFPTRVRSAGFGLVDGVGVLGGAMGVLVIAPLVPRLSPLPALLLIAAFLVVSAILAQFTPHTRNRVLEDVSP
ncbi:MFS family permease [Amycolatopsis bartoniae]|uniref:MFS transporter n=1 Tax=Amycolatopsis bartoniae TaxID=941986 RepID=A0A8H9IR98_9PSEU|nr:MFS transporter [Amycolatopsis bartoniae]MBB2936768.1 MFS family permease [Amycolatopsis bartoniae]TVT09183.1 sugar porter family MFS transporter [Amycolatopsis bartoniae]GHF49984.1 MFS transporter [Amycolatopsis bartoniae]